MANNDSPKVPLDNLLKVDHLLDTILETAEILIYHVLCEFAEQIINKPKPREKVPLEDIFTVQYFIITTLTTTKDVSLFVPRRWYKWASGPRDHSRKVPLSDLATLSYLSSAIVSSLPTSIARVTQKVYQHITRFPLPSPTAFLNDTAYHPPIPLLATLKSTALKTLLIRPSSTTLALQPLCATMISHSLLIHSGARLPSTLYSSSAPTIVPDASTQEESDRAMTWSRAQEARDFANGMTSDFRRRLAADYLRGWRFSLDEYDLLGEMGSLREGLGDRCFGLQGGRREALGVLEERLREMKREEGVGGLGRDRGE